MTEKVEERKAHELTCSVRSQETQAGKLQGWKELLFLGTRSRITGKLNNQKVCDPQWLYPSKLPGLLISKQSGPRFSLSTFISIVPSKHLDKAGDQKIFDKYNRQLSPIQLRYPFTQASPLLP